MRKAKGSTEGAAPGRRSDAPSVAGLTVRQAEILLAEARREKRERAEFERRKAKGKPLAKTTQSAIRYEKCFESGVVKIEDGLYSLTCDVRDMDYRNMSNGEKEGVFKRLMNAYNVFEPSTHLQWTIKVRIAENREILDDLVMDHAEDGLDHLRDEVNEVYRRRAAQGGTDVETRLMLTIATKADNAAEAESILRGLVGEVSPDFESFGSKLTPLDGSEWLEEAASAFWPDDVLCFDWDTLLDERGRKASGLTTKDAIAPMSLAFQPRILKPRPNGTTSAVRDSGVYRFNDYWGSVMLLRKSPGEIDDRMLSEMASVPMDMTITIHVQPASREASMKATEAYVAALEGDSHDRAVEAKRERISEGVMMTSKHRDAKEDAEELKREVHFGGHRLFYTTMTASTYADNPDDLKGERIPKIRRAGERWGVTATPLSGRGRQEDALNATLPIGKNFVNAPATMTTANVAALIPFGTRRYQDPDGVYWGVNSESKDFIVVDRTKLSAPHQMAFGITGSGKTFGLEREHMQVLLRRPQARVYMVTPGVAYKPFVQMLGGTWLEVGAGSRDRFNPLSIDLDRVEDPGAAMADKTEYLMGQVECILYKGSPPSSGDSRAARDSSLLYSCVQECVPAVYKRYASTHDQKDVPVLEQLADALAGMRVPVARDAAQALRLFSTPGAVGGQFSQQDGNPLSSESCRLFGIGFKNAGDVIKAPALFAFTDVIWRAAMTNKVLGYETWVVFDEFQSFMDYPIAAQYFLRAWTEGRKYDLYQTGATQNVMAVLANEKASRALSNSGIVTMYNMAHDDAAALGVRLRLSDRQVRYTVNPAEGHGLLSVMGAVMPFEDAWPKDTESYRVMTTKPSETAGRAM